MSDSKLVIVEFPNEATRDDFVAWMCEGGGEYMFMESRDEAAPPIERFDYNIDSEPMEIICSAGY